MDCVHDTDCPGTHACHHGACQCLSEWGWTGEDCMEFGSFVYFSVIFSCLTVLVSLVVCVVSSYGVFAISRYLKCSFSLTNNLIIVTSTLVAALSLAVYKILWIVTILSPGDVNIQYVRGIYYKLPRLYYFGYTNPILFIGFVSSLMAFFHLGIIWAQLAYTSRTISTMDESLNVFKGATVGFELSLVIICVVMGAFNYYGWWFIATFPYFVALLGLWIMGRIQIVESLKRSLSLTLNVDSDAKTKEVVQLTIYENGVFSWRSRDSPPIKRTIKAIQRCSMLGFVIFSLIGILRLVIGCLNVTGGRRMYMEHGVFGVYGPLVEVMELLTALALLLITDFTHPNVVRQILNTKAGRYREYHQEFPETTAITEA
mmetsp:Transcript_8898/g.14465  ORF Transcript_8898/g.14465 Transcript_8898/m.14465 type:complete len:372 (+) Transcript_8898:78-1193(+)